MEKNLSHNISISIILSMWWDFFQLSQMQANSLKPWFPDSEKIVELISVLFGEAL